MGVDWGWGRGGEEAWFIECLIYDADGQMQLIPVTPELHTYMIAA